MEQRSKSKRTKGKACAKIENGPWTIGDDNDPANNFLESLTFQGAILHSVATSRKAGKAVKRGPRNYPCHLSCDASEEFGKVAGSFCKEAQQKFTDAMERAAQHLELEDPDQWEKASEIIRGIVGVLKLARTPSTRGADEIAAGEPEKSKSRRRKCRKKPEDAEGGEIEPHLTPCDIVMIEYAVRNPEAKYFSARKWMEAINYSDTTICDTATWDSFKVYKERSAHERVMQKYGHEVDPSEVKGRMLRAGSLLVKNAKGNWDESREHDTDREHETDKTVFQSGSESDSQECLTNYDTRPWES